VVNTLADNPEVIPAAVTPLVGGAIPAYMVAKSAIYKGLKIPTPGHMRHLKQKAKHKEIAIATGVGVGATAAGIAGHQAMGKKQKKGKARRSREARSAKRAEMYKYAALELQKTAVSGQWIEGMVRSGMSKASPQRGMQFLRNMEKQTGKTEKLVKAQTRKSDKIHAAVKKQEIQAARPTERVDKKLEDYRGNIRANNKTYSEPETMKTRFLERQLGKRQAAGSVGIDAFGDAEKVRMRAKFKRTGAIPRDAYGSTRLTMDIPRSRANQIARNPSYRKLRLPNEPVLSKAKAPKL
jgi:hypothetical protein